MSKKRPLLEPNIPITNGIGIFLHCGLCVQEAGSHGQSPKDYARLEIGYTRLGIQAWCLRHDVNVIHMDLEVPAPRRERHPHGPRGTEAPREPDARGPRAGAATQEGQALMPRYVFHLKVLVDAPNVPYPVAEKHVERAVSFCEQSLADALRPDGVLVESLSLEKPT